MNLAEFKCVRCGFVWSDVPGPTSCPVCGHLYVEWTNYEQWRKNNDEEEAV